MFYAVEISKSATTKKKKHPAKVTENEGGHSV
jgi:hypothetical protein